MSDSDKTRPKTNFHCFDGFGLVYWGNQARGLKPKSETKSTPSGHVFEYEKDVDGFAKQNGGMFSPEVTTLQGSRFVRFFGGGGTADRAMGGRWWIDFDTFTSLYHWAENQGMPISKAAQLQLVVPKDWNDCTQFVVATRIRPVKGFLGKGKPAAITSSGEGISPDSANREKGSGSLHGPTGDNNMKQIFIPGDNDLIKSSFREISKHRVDKKGKIQPPLFRTY